MSSPSQAPNIAQIILPPGFTLPEYEKLQGQLVTIGIVTAVAFALVCWDYVVLLRDELKLYVTNTRAIWRTPATLAFIVLRYSAFLATLPSLFFTSIQSQHCQTAVIASQVGAVLVVAASGVIFSNRVVAIWGNSKFIIAVTVVAWLGLIGCWISVATQYNAITGPTTPFASNCQMQPIVSWAPISYASSVVFDIIVLALTVFKLRANGLEKSAVSRQIFRDNLAYFVVTAATNIVVLSIQALGESFSMIKPTAVPFSTVITVAMSERVYLNLKLLRTREERGRHTTLGSSAPTYMYSVPGSGAPETLKRSAVPQTWGVTPGWSAGQIEEGPRYSEAGTTEVEGWEMQNRDAKPWELYNREAKM
ncbi:hypothetical protein PUNSTDRAFT_145066 [Punctularia strigosozonata HHB-11173 SS5]|uniref:uncharacterized protein n=1 Tax=Punctularia strigosozonata (strain HHB-11173) TaxID=741275 RepID=UPI00044174D5|nr:uncharacterized protein PUNSTDRAFT_145066 [Punctularia strigosozonata HHB-11173 SS5]EIN06478.1 hypothetical protein PUNSTDRAFT_145066 [Punctularia strigosozonata HHB-11173 SS5]